MPESSRERLPEPEPTVDSLVEFTATLQNILDDIFELISTQTGDFKEDELNTERLWTDEKPIYRQVWSGTTGTGASTNVSSGVAIDTLVSCRVRIVNLNGSFVGSDSNTTDLEVSLDSQGSFLISHNTATLQNQRFVIIAEYTKLD